MKPTTKLLTFFAFLGLIAFTAGCPGNTTKTNTTANAARNTANPIPTANPNAPAGAQPPNMRGAATAAVTVEEFADFQCPTCATVHEMMKNVTGVYGSRIKFIYRNFPLTQIHKNAYDAALAAEAAGLQGRFWEMQNQLFTNQQAWSNSSDARTLFTGYAEKVGLDTEKFQSDLVALPTKQRVDSDIERGRALNVSGTPTIYINGRTVPPAQMNVDSLRSLIDAELQNVALKNQSQPPAGSTAPSAAANTSATANTSAANSTSTNTSAANGAK